jgi:hypothetical protein
MPFHRLFFSFLLISLLFYFSFLLFFNSSLLTSHFRDGFSRQVYSRDPLTRAANILYSWLCVKRKIDREELRPLLAGVQVTFFLKKNIKLSLNWEEKSYFFILETTFSLFFIFTLLNSIFQFFSLFSLFFFFFFNKQI